MKIRVGVTGGAGYIGSHMVHTLLDAGCSVVVLDNLSTGNEENLFEHPDLSFIRGDTGNLDDLNRFFSFRPEAVFHFAAWKAAGESMVDPEKYSYNNIRNACMLIEETARHGCRNFIFSSSAAVYGRPETLPIRETHPLQPINYYGFTKYVIEKNLEWFSSIRGLRFASLRYFNAAGYDPAGRVPGIETIPNNLIPLLMEVAIGKRPLFEMFGDDYETPDGSCIRDYIHVSDLADAHMKALNYVMSEQKNLVVNLGSQEGISVFEMLETAKKITGREIPSRIAPRRDGDTDVLIADASLARSVLQWNPRYSDIHTILESAWKVYAAYSKKGAV